MPEAEVLSPQAQRLEEALDRRPIISWLLVLFNTGLYAWCAWLSGSANVSAEVMAVGWKVPSAVRAGQAWRLVSCIFLHANLLHLLLNMIGILNVGSIVERLVGRAAYLTLFVAAGVCGALLSVACGPYAGVGSSGAVLGLLGAAFVLAVRYGRPMRETLGRWFALQCFVLLVANIAFGFGVLVARVDNLAHLGGIACGLTATWLCDLRPLRTGRHPWRRTTELALCAATLGVLAATGVMVYRATQPAKNVEWHLIRGLDIALEVPTTWIGRAVGPGLVEYGAQGVPAVLQVERVRLSRAVAAAEEETVLRRLLRERRLISEPVPLTGDGGSHWWQASFREGDVVEWYVHFEGDEMVRVIGRARIDRTRQYRPVFQRAATTLRDLRLPGVEVPDE